MTTIREIQAFLQQKAPFETAEDWDNAGLLAGDPDTAVTGILLTLDITPQAVDFAADNGFGLIVSHHPVIFHPLRRLEPSGAPYALARRGVAALCAHTNLDKAPGGVNDTLAVLLGLRDVQATPDSLCRIGELPEPLSPDALATLTAERLHTDVRLCAGAREIRRVGLCTGAGGEFAAALSGRIDAFITGEVHHHEWLQAAQDGITLIEAGHYATEIPVTRTLYEWLQAAFPKVHCRIFDQPAPYRAVSGR